MDTSSAVPKSLKSGVARIWHGWTSPADAGSYEALLREEIFVNFQNRRIKGLRGIKLLRSDLDDETEFAVIMLFDSLDAVREFAGEDYETAVVPDKAKTLLSRYDKRSRHYKIAAEM